MCNSDFEILQIYSEIMKVKQGSVREDQDVEEMLLLLATIYESARLLPAGPLLQRCSLKDGKRLPFCLPSTGK